jgi:hypothetical protein
MPEISNGAPKISQHTIQRAAQDASRVVGEYLRVSTTTGPVSTATMSALSATPMPSVDGATCRAPIAYAGRPESYCA